MCNFDKNIYLINCFLFLRIECERITNMPITKPSLHKMTIRSELECLQHCLSANIKNGYRCYSVRYDKPKQTCEFYDKINFDVYEAGDTQGLIVYACGIHFIFLFMYYYYSNYECFVFLT